MRQADRPAWDKANPLDGSEQVAAAQYVASLSGELAEIARRHRLDTLAHILDMARLEAEQAGAPSRDYN
jgi:hypothetical protein